MSTFQPTPNQGYRIGERLVLGAGFAKQKRFLVFASSSYYPVGGWADCIGSADTLEDAVAAAKAANEDWSQVVDLETGEEVA